MRVRLELTGVGRWRPGLGWVLARDSSSWRRRRCRHVSGAWGRCRRRRRLSSDSSWATAKCWSRKFGSALGCRWRCSDQSSFATSLCLSRIDSHLIVFYVGFFDDCGNWRSPLRITNRSKTDHFRFSLIVLFGAKRFLILAYHALLRDKKEEENGEHVTGIVLLQPDHFLILKFGPKKTVLVEKAVRKLLRRLFYLPLTQLTWSAMINLCSGNGLAWIEPAKERYKKFFYFSLWLISFSSWFDDDFSSLSSTSSQLKNFFQLRCGFDAFQQLWFEISFSWKKAEKEKRWWHRWKQKSISIFDFFVLILKNEANVVVFASFSSMLRHFVSRAGDYSWINFGADYERTCPFNVVKRDRTFRVQLPRTQNPANTTTKLFGNSASENVSRGVDVTCVGSRESTNELNTRGGWMQMGQRGKNILIETRWTTMSLKKK